MMRVLVLIAGMAVAGAAGFYAGSGKSDGQSRLTDPERSKLVKMIARRGNLSVAIREAYAAPDFDSAKAILAAAVEKDQQDAGLVFLDDITAID